MRKIAVIIFFYLVFLAGCIRANPVEIAEYFEHSNEFATQESENYVYDDVDYISNETQPLPDYDQLDTPPEVNQPDVTRQPITFSTINRINPYMDKFVFTIIGYRDTTFSPIYDFHSIIITTIAGDLVQEITGLSTDSPTVGEDSMHGLRFEDWNFDGYMDIALRSSRGGTMLNDPHFVWLWDGTQFVRNVDLENISSEAGIWVEENNERVVAHTRIGPHGHIRKFYEHRNGNFVEVGFIRREFLYHNSYEDYPFVFLRTTEADHTSGLWVITETDYYSGEELYHRVEQHEATP